MQRPLSYIWIIALILLIYPHPALAQKKVRRMTLEEATFLAKERSIQALIAKQQFKVSYLTYKTFRRGYLPQLSASGTLPDFERNIASYLNPDQSYSYLLSQSINYIGNVSLNQKIGFTGGDISLNSGLQRIDNLNPSSTISNNSTPISYYSSPLNIQYSQPIFMFNSYKWDRKLQPLKYDQAKRIYLESIEDINIMTTNYFFAVLEAQVEKKIAETNYQNYDTLYKITQGRFQLGKIPQNQLLLYELSLLKAKLAIENAKLSLDDALFVFKSFLRLTESDSIVLLPPVNIAFFMVDPFKAIDEAFENTSPAEDFTRQLLEADMGVNKARMDGRFDANLRAKFGINQTAPTLSDAYKSSQDLEGVTLQLNIPIIDWGVARGNIKIAESQRDIVKNQVEQGIIDFRQGIYRNVMKFNMQQNQLQIAAKADTVAKKSYQITQDRYMIGKISDFQELYTAQTEADNSENAFFAALQSYWQQYYSIRKSTLFDFQRQSHLQFNISDINP
jgi:outer membrane protein